MTKKQISENAKNRLAFQRELEDKFQEAREKYFKPYEQFFYDANYLVEQLSDAEHGNSYDERAIKALCERVGVKLIFDPLAVTKDERDSNMFWMRSDITCS